MWLQNPGTKMDVGVEFIKGNLLFFNYFYHCNI
jgi:hypothetical protein